MPLRFSGIAAGLCAVAIAVSAEAGPQLSIQAQPNPTPAPPEGSGRQRTPSNPFGNLFRPSPGLGRQPGSATEAPRVACGMTVVPVDPRFDARFRKAAPQQPRPRTRTLQTPTCR